MKKISFSLLLVLLSLNLRSQVFRSLGCEEELYADALVHLNAYRSKDAIQVLQQIAATAFNEKNNACYIRARYEIARCLEIQDENTKALGNFRDLLKESTMQGDKEVEGFVYLGMARLYEKQNLMIECGENLQRVKSIIDTYDIADSKLKAFYFIRSASYFRLNGELDRAYDQTKALLLLAAEKENKEFVGIANMLAALILRDKNDLDKAIIHYEAAAAAFKNSEDYHGYFSMIRNLGLIYNKQGNSNQAISYLKKADEALDLSFDKGSGLDEYLFFKKRLANTYSEIYQQQNKYDSAYFILKNMTAVIDSIQSEDYNALSVQVEEMLLYNKEKDKLLLLEKEKLILREKKNKYWLVLGLGVAVFFLYLLNQSRRKIAKANEEIFAQKEEIESQNIDLSLSLRYQKVLLGELHHRVKNNHQMILNFLEMHIQKAGSSAEEANFEVLKGRIFALSSLHEGLYDEEFEEGNLTSYLKKLLEHFSQISDASVFLFEDKKAKDICFDLNDLISLGIILNELFTNSLKYSGLPQSDLRIDLKLNYSTDDLYLNYKDNGVGYSSNPFDNIDNTESLGVYLISTMVRQMRGELEVRDSEGVCIDLNLSNSILVNS